MTSETTAPSGALPPITDVQTQQSSTDRLWSVFCHLAYIFGGAVLSFVFPLVVYLVMRGESPYVGHHAREALNFHLSILLYALLCVPLCFIIIGIPLLAAIGLTGLVCSIIAAVKASRGVYYHYPVTIRFVN